MRKAIKSISYTIITFIFIYFALALIIGFENTNTLAKSFFNGLLTWFK